LDDNTKYFTKMYALYSYTKYSLKLFDTTKNLWWANSTYANTNTYWSRGNGWVFAAHAKVLSVLPTSDPHYAEYVSTFQDFAGPESSGTSFFLYGMAWGVSTGLLNETTYLPAIVNAWSFLANTAIQSS